MLERTRRWAKRSLATRALLALAGIGAPACKLVQTATHAPSKLLGGGSPAVTKIDPASLTARLMRFADVGSVEITLATRAFANQADTQEARIQALSWRIEYTQALWKRAVGPRPFESLFDTILVLTALRDAHAERWLAEWGEPDQPVLDALARLEKSAWVLANECLTDEQLEQVHALIDDWQHGDRTPLLLDVSQVPGLSDIASRNKGEGERGAVGELASLIELDPMSGLDPAIREVEQTRQLAERVFYFIQRLPELVSARVELLALRSSQAPDVQNAIAAFDRVSHAATSMAATAEALPATLEAQRAGLLRDLDSAKGPAVEVLGEARALAEALTEAIRQADTLTARFAKDASKPAEPRASEPPARPFDINEYSAAAQSLADASRALGATIATLDESLPELQRALDEAAARADESIDRVFWRSVALVAIAIVLAAAAVLVVRRASSRARGA